jgi:hypothetical protein
MWSTTMAIKQWTLTDVSSGVYIDDLRVTHDQVGGDAKGYEVSKRTLRGGLCDGVDVVRIDNGRLEVELLPTRGMGIWRMALDGVDLGWHSPVRGPVHPGFVPLMEPSGLGWLDGFDEFLARCGLESNGAPDFDERGQLIYPLHGRIANRPAHRVDLSLDDATGEITVTGVVEETRFHFSKLRLTSKLVTRVDEPAIRVYDQVENLSGSEAEIQLLYHINFGSSLLGPGSRFVAPVARVVPRNGRAAEGIGSWSEFEGEQAGYEEQVYFMELAAADDGRTRTMLKNADGTRAVSVCLNKNQLPCYTLWKNTITASDGYTTGLEPGTNFPNPRTYEGRQGRVVRLEPGGQAVFELALEAHHGAAEVGAAERAIADLQAGLETEVHAQPQPGWCDL